MPLNTDQVFINRVKEIFGVAEGRRKLFEEQQRVLDDVLGGMTDEVKESIRKGMSFKVKKNRFFGGNVKSLDKGGQLEELEPEDAVKKYNALSNEDRKKSQEAMDTLMQGYYQKIRQAKDKSGKPLFGDPFAERTLKERHESEGEPKDEEGKARRVRERKEAIEEQERARKQISQDFFEPLVREGVIPEWVVPLEFSKTQRYLDATYSRYKKTLEEQRKAKISGKTKMEVDIHGGGNLTDQFKAGVGKLAGITDNLLDKISLGTHEERSRALGIAGKTASFALSTISAISEVDGLVSGDSMKEAKESMSYGDALTSTTYAKIGDHLANMGISGDQITEVLKALDTAKANGTLELIQEGTLAPIELIQGSLETILTGLEIGGKNNILDAVGQGVIEARIEAGVAKLVPKIDSALEAALTKASPVAGAAAKGAFEVEADTGRLVRMLTAKKIDGMGEAAFLVDGTEEFVDALGEGLYDAIAECLPGDDVFDSVGKSVQAAFKPDHKALRTTMGHERTVDKAFETILEAATTAIAKAIPADLPEDEPSGSDASLFRGRLSQPDVLKKILKNVTEKELKPPEEVEEQSEEELLEYEAALTLCDEGGELAAMTQSIDKLIADLEKGQKIVELVEQLGGTIIGLAGSGNAIAAAAIDHAKGVATKTADMLSNEAVPVLKAAKLILKLGLQIKLMADRLKLWNKFRVQVARSQKAGSPLSPAIKGFYNNKKEQVVFHGIEMAMVSVQIAGAVCECTHDPHAIAVGKAVGAIGSAGEAGNALASSIYSEVQLRRGWTTTKEAMNNPANRKLGLKALMINPTMAMHAIAYAAKVERDVTARDFLKACGLNENTLDVSGATEEKIREYMTTLLYEDRKLTDPEKIRTDWQPDTIELTKANWVITCTRAKGKKVVPPLSDSQPAGIGTGLGDLDAAADYLKPLLAADAGKLQGLLATKEDHVTKLTKLHAVAIKLNKELDGYSPKAKDGTAHEDMQMIVLQYQSKAEDMEIRLEMLVAEAKIQVSSLHTE